MSDESLAGADGRKLLSEIPRWLAKIHESGVHGEEAERILVARVTDTVNVARAAKGRLAMENEVATMGSGQ